MDSSRSEATWQRYSVNNGCPSPQSPHSYFYFPTPLLFFFATMPSSLFLCHRAPLPLSPATAFLLPPLSPAASITAVRGGRSDAIGRIRSADPPETVAQQGGGEDEAHGVARSSPPLCAAVADGYRGVAGSSSLPRSRRCRFSLLAAMRREGKRETPEETGTGIGRCNASLGSVSGKRELRS